MDSVYLLVLWIAVCIAAVGSGLIWLDHKLEEKRECDHKKFVREMAGTILDGVKRTMVDTMDVFIDKSVEMTRRMYKVDDDEPKEADEEFKKEFDELDGDLTI